MRPRSSASPSRTTHPFASSYDYTGAATHRLRLTIYTHSTAESVCECQHPETLDPLLLKHKLLSDFLFFSSILASTSKVFGAPLRGCFAEGEAIRAGTREIYMTNYPCTTACLVLPSLSTDRLRPPHLRREPYRGERACHR
jgi:hypothetical protein